MADRQRLKIAFEDEDLRRRDTGQAGHIPTDRLGLLFQSGIWKQAGDCIEDEFSSGGRTGGPGSNQYLLSPVRDDRHVADDRTDGGADRQDDGIRREERSVFAPVDQLAGPIPAGGHGRLHVFIECRRVDTAPEKLPSPPDDLVSAVPADPLESPVDITDSSFRVQHDDRVGRVLYGRYQSIVFVLRYGRGGQVHGQTAYSQLRGACLQGELDEQHVVRQVARLHLI